MRQITTGFNRENLIIAEPCSRSTRRPSTRNTQKNSHESPSTKPERRTRIITHAPGGPPPLVVVGKETHFETLTFLDTGKQGNGIRIKKLCTHRPEEHAQSVTTKAQSVTKPKAERELMLRERRKSFWSCGRTRGRTGENPGKRKA